MNIVIFSWRGPGHPNAGGAEYVTHEYAKAWVEAGHKVTLFTSSFSGAKKKEIVDRVEVLRKGGQDFGVKLSAFLWYLSGKHPQYDLVVDHFHGIPFFTPLYIRTKKLAFIHEVAKEVWKLNPWPKPFNLIPYIIGVTLEPFIFKLFYKGVPFLTVSESTKNDLIDFGIPKNNVNVIYNGIDASGVPKRLHPKEKKKTAIFLGAISRDKGIEDALKAFGLINKSDPSWQFWIVGRASLDMRNYLKKEIEKLDIKKNTRYLGFIDDKKKFELLARAHVLVNPSVREGWGLVNIEANAVGTPVIGYDNPGLRDSIRGGKTGVLCKGKSPEYMAYELEKLVNDEKRYKIMSEVARKWVKQFDWEKSTTQSIELIESIVV